MPDLPIGMNINPIAPMIANKLEKKKFAPAKEAKLPIKIPPTNDIDIFIKAFII